MDRPARLKAIDLAAAVAIVFFASTPAFAQLLQADFDTGVISPYSAIESPPATRTPLFGGTLRIEVSPGNGNATTGETTTSYGDILAVVDVLDWTAGLEQSVSLSTLTSPMAGVFDGYVLRLDPDLGTIQLIKLANSVGVDTATSAAIVLAPASTDYRLVFRRNGTQLEGELYDLKALSAPITTVSLTDLSGIPGFTVGLPSLIVEESTTAMLGADVTIDNLVFVRQPPGSDIEGDGFTDSEDLCQLVANGVNTLSLQVDSDLDGYGNACDADFNNDFVITLADLVPLFGDFGTLATGPSLRLDLDGDRAVTLADIAIYWSSIASVPGP